MSRFQIALIASLSCLAAAAFGGTAVPARAAATDSIAIMGAGSPAGNRGDLYVKIQATTGISNITVNLQYQGTTHLTIPFSGFALTSGTSTNGTWTVTNPITTSQLSLGDYEIVVDASDTGGTSVSGLQAGLLQFMIEPTLTASPDRTAIDHDHPSVTFSGTITGLYPDGTTSPLASQALVLQQGGAGPAAHTTTGTDGSYSLTTNPPSTATFTAQYYVAFAPTATALGTQTQDFPITAHVDPVQVTAGWKTSPVKYQATATLTGTVTYQPGSTWQPLAGSPVQLYNGSPAASGFVPFATALTGADGAYTMSFPAVPTTNFVVYAGDLPGAGQGSDPLLGAASVVPPPLPLVLPVHIVIKGAAISPFGAVSIHGCMTIPTQSPPQALPLTLEYSRAAGGPWTALRTLKTVRPSPCGTNANWFGATIRAPLPSAYYRVSYPGSTGYQPGVSAAVHLAKLLTKITSFNVSPRSVRRNGHVSVTGRLWQHLKTWKPYPHRKILILFIYRKKVYAYRTEPRTNRAGWFTVPLPAAVSARWFAQYNGDATHFASASVRISVKVT